MKTNNKNMFNDKLLVSYLFFICVCIGGYIVPGTNFSLGITIGFGLAVIWFSRFILMSDKTFLINKSLLLFFFYVIISQLLIGVVKNEFLIIKNLIIVIFSTFTVIIVYNIVSEENFFKAYKTFGIISLVGLFYHVIIVYILKQPVSPIIILPNAFMPETNWAYDLYRPMSIFQEPAAYAGFMLPLLAYSIYKKRIMFSIIVTISILFSTSSIGIIVAFGIWVYSIFFVVKSKSLKFGLVLLYLMILIFFLSNDMFSYPIERIKNINLENDTRLTNGFFILRNMNSEDLIFGIGMGSISTYINMHGLLFNDYNSSFAGVIINWGVIGIILYLTMLFKFLIKQNRNVQLFVLMIIILSFVQTIVFNLAFQYYFLSYFVCANKGKRSYIGIKFR